MPNLSFPRIPLLIAAALLSGLLAGCAPEPVVPEEQLAAARRELRARRALHEVTTKLHLPALDATGASRETWLARAEAGYEKVIADHETQTNVAAPAWRGLGNVLVEMGRVSEAVSAYGMVSSNYPTAEWEVLQTWKAAGDVLWSRSRTNEAVPYYQALVAKFGGRTNSPPILEKVLEGARAKLEQAGMR